MDNKVKQAIISAVMLSLDTWFPMKPKRNSTTSTKDTSGKYVRVRRVTDFGVCNHVIEAHTLFGVIQVQFFGFMPMDSKAINVVAYKNNQQLFSSRIDIPKGKRKTTVAEKLKEHLEEAISKLPSY